MKSIFKNSSIIMLCAMLGLLSNIAAHGQVIIGVSPFSATNYANNVNGMSGSNPGLGETFTVPSNYPVLNSINLYATTITNAEAGLNASLYQWSSGADSTVGSALWSSTTPQTIPGSNSSTPYLLSFATGGVQLNPADSYVLEFTAYSSALVTGVPALFEVVPATYAGGNVVAFVSNTYYPTANANLDFTAGFSAAPEPSTWALLLVGVGLLAWRFRTRKA